MLGTSPCGSSDPAADKCFHWLHGESGVGATSASVDAYHRWDLAFDANYANSTYKNNQSTVQAPAIKALVAIRY
jgi:hypothetical protein